MYLFLQKDLEDLRSYVSTLEIRVAEIMGGIHDTTTQSSETWHDNPQFEEQQRQFKMWKQRLDKFAAMLGNSKLITPNATPVAAEIGSVVAIEDLTTKEVETYVIGSYMVLGEDEGRISYETPLAKLLLGGKEGETRGGVIADRDVSYKILSISPLVQE